MYMFSEETVNWKQHNPRQVPEYSGVCGLVRGCWGSRKFMARPLDRDLNGNHQIGSPKNIVGI